jgi:cardiolipin synthase
MPIAEVISILVWINAIVVVVILIYEERDPSTTLAWALGLMLLPGIGLVFYLLFGRNWRIIGKRDQRRVEALRLGAETLAPIYARWSARALAELDLQPEFARRVSRAITRQNGTLLLPSTGLELFTSGAEKFPRLLDDIADATDSIHLEYFIWESDELTERLCALLAEKARAGVEVRILYDWVGSLPYSKRQLKELERAGGHVHPDAAHWSKLNYRNHRKIAVMDGRIAYTGGMNMGQEYIDGKPRYDSWRDTHVRFTGPLVADLQRLFCERWFRVARESLFSERYFPELGIADGGRVIWAQLAFSGAESQWMALRNTFLLAILSAEKAVRIQSPYFVPDESVLEALVTQSLAGVDVRLMMTGVPDKRLAWNAAFSYIDELIEADGRMFQYDAGFFHPKAMTIDGQLAVIGTTNFDIRSFMLHDELSLFFFSSEVAAEQDEIFERDVLASHEVLSEVYHDFGKVQRFRNALARLSSRLL